MAFGRNEYVNEPNKLSLLNLPLEVIEHIAKQASPYESRQIKAALSETCRYQHAFFQPQLDAEKLLRYVLQGKAAEAKAMYEANPELLFMETSSKDYAAGIDKDGKAVHRVIEGSPFRAALGAGDYRMLEDMLTYVGRVVDRKGNQIGHQLAAEQTVQQFPNGVDYPASTYDFGPLVAAITTDPELIAERTARLATKEVLQQFRNDFMPGVVSVGHHFNLNELIKACEVYNQNFNPWNSKQLSFFFSQVIGYLERLLPTVDAQVLCQGIANMTEGNKPMERKLDLTNYVTNNTISYYPLDADLACRLGVHLGVDTYYWPGGACAWGRCGCVWRRILGELMSSKSSRLGELYTALAPTTRAACR